MKLLPYTSFFLGYPIMHLRVNPTVVFSCRDATTQWLDRTEKLGICFCWWFLDRFYHGKSPFFTTTIWELWFILFEKASWPFANQRQRGWYIFTKSGPLCPLNRLPKTRGMKKTNSTPTKTAPKDLEFQQVFGSPVDFFVAISRKWIHNV